MVWNGKAIPVPFLAALSEAERITEAGIKYHKVSGAVYPAGYGHGGNRGGAEDFWRGSVRSGRLSRKNRSAEGGKEVPDGREKAGKRSWDLYARQIKNPCLVVTVQS